jgi:NAD-dependent DNA ligase
MDKVKLYIDASVAYNKGNPIMTNQEFDALERELRAEGHLDTINKTHDQHAGSDIDDLTFSINPLETWGEIIGWVRASKQVRFFLSSKMDGVLGKAVFPISRFVGQSRGRDTLNPWDYTNGLRSLMPQLHEEALVIGEAFVPPSELDFFRKKYDGNFAVPRSAAISLLRVPSAYAEEDLKRMKFKAYSIDRQYELRSEMYADLVRLGFEVPPHYVVEIAPGLDDSTIQVALEEYMELLSSNPDIPLDGIVMEYDDLMVTPDVQGKYLSTQIALKVGIFGETTFKGTVTGLTLTPGKGSFGTVLDIEPVRMPDGITVSKINAFNPGIILRNKITKGTEISFARKANSMCVLLYEK